jgi:hypothetical protein
MERRKMGIDGEEMAMASESAMAWNASTYHDALMRGLKKGRAE